jgi:hypothetical protein
MIENEQQSVGSFKINLLLLYNIEVESIISSYLSLLSVIAIKFCFLQNFPSRIILSYHQHHPFQQLILCAIQLPVSANVGIGPIIDPLPVKAAIPALSFVFAFKY